MSNTIKAVFAATGSYIPENKVVNADFLNHHFTDKNGTPITIDNAVVIEKFKEITGIEERRYASTEQTASDLGFLAAEKALTSSGIDPETLDYIIVAHNFGDVIDGSNRSDMVPSLASRIKYKLGIKNPDCVAYDLPFGCPGWVQGVIQANYYIQAGDAKRCMVIGTETLSRVINPHDRDSMLYGDGAGATILEAAENSETGILAHKTQTHGGEYATLLSMEIYKQQHDDVDNGNLFVKMNGRKLYEFALTQVPLVIKAALEKAGVGLADIKKVLIHQANHKMDSAILQRLFKLYDMECNDESIMPMTISWLGNSSVATVPTLLDLIKNGKMEGHELKKGDLAVIASVGAGMNINAIIYRF